MVYSCPRNRVLAPPSDVVGAPSADSSISLAELIRGLWCLWWWKVRTLPFLHKSLGIMLSSMSGQGSPFWCERIGCTHWNTLPASLEEAMRWERGLRCGRWSEGSVARSREVARHTLELSGRWRSTVGGDSCSFRNYPASFEFHSEIHLRWPNHVAVDSSLRNTLWSGTDRCSLLGLRNYRWVVMITVLRTSNCSVSRLDRMKSKVASTNQKCCYWNRPTSSND